MLVSPQKKSKQIILIRHARAFSVEENGGDDFGRGLSPSGQKAIQTIVRYLGLIGLRPEMLLTSDAVRAVETSQPVIDRFQIPIHRAEHALYESYISGTHDDKSLYLSLLHSVPSHLSTLVGVGHGENIEACVQYFTGESMVHMDEGSVVILALDEGIDWPQVGENTMKLVYYVTPRFLQLENFT